MTRQHMNLCYCTLQERMALHSLAIQRILCHQAVFNASHHTVRHREFCGSEDVELLRG